MNRRSTTTTVVINCSDTWLHQGSARHVWMLLSFVHCHRTVSSDCNVPSCTTANPLISVDCCLLSRFCTENNLGPFIFTFLYSVLPAVQMLPRVGFGAVRIWPARFLFMGCKRGTKLGCRLFCYLHCESKKWAAHVTVSILDRFTKFFCCFKDR